MSILHAEIKCLLLSPLEESNKQRKTIAIKQRKAINETHLSWWIDNPKNPGTISEKFIRRWSIKNQNYSKCS